MKKIQNVLLAVLSPLCLLGTSACSSTEEDSISYLNYGKLYDEKIDENDSDMKFQNHSISLSYGDLAGKISKKQSFLLLVYEKGNTCTCWYRYETTLLKYMKKHNALIYGIDPSEFGGGRETYGINYSSSEENIVIFDNGEILEQRSTNGVDDDFVEYDIFSAWLNKRIHLSDTLLIEKNQLDDLFSSSPDPSFMVYYGRESCGDCSYIDQNFLYAYNKKDHVTNYYIDCDAVGIRFDSEEDKKNGKVSDDWVTFKNEYGLSELYNESLGYGEGYVPSFIVYNRGLISDGAYSLVKDMAVSFNDVVIEEGGVYTVSDSFYSKERLENSECFNDDGIDTYVLKGKTLSSEDVIAYPEYNYIEWKKDKAIEAHKPLLEKFLNFYLSL